MECNKLLLERARELFMSFYNMKVDVFDNADNIPKDCWIRLARKTFEYEKKALLEVYVRSERDRIFVDYAYDGLLPT